MGDARHKRSPPQGKAKPVTELFKLQAKAAMAMNAAYNLQHELKPGQDGYRPATAADLERETGADANLLKHMFGGVRPGTKTKKIGASKYVDPIAQALGIQQTETVEIRADRADLVRWLNALPDEVFKDLQAKIRALENAAK